MNNHEATFFIKCPVEFQHLCLIYPPSVKEVCTNENFYSYLKLLTISQEEIEDQFVEEKIDLSNLLTPLEYLLNNTYNNKEFESIAKNAFYFFIHENITLLYEQKKIILGDIKNVQSFDKLRIIDEDNYFDFQNLIRESTGLKTIEPPDPNENPRIKAIKAKARYRDKIKAKKGMGLNLISLLASICCMNFGLNPLNIGELSYASAQNLIKIYQQKEKYELDVDSLLAGADSKKVKPKYWIRNLED